jgi:SprT-like family
MTMSNDKQPEPTAEQFDAYRAMFDHFNARLFGGALPPVILNFSRHAGAVGFFIAEKWRHVMAGATAHEISLNPSYLAMQPTREIASTLVHEMAHLWQHVHGKPSRGYHNREWAEKMASLGFELVNAKTGKPSMSAPALVERTVEGGAFALAFDALPAAALLPWTCGDAAPAAQGATTTTTPGAPGASNAGGARPRLRNKLKYTCPSCGANVWGRHSLKVLCDDGHDPERLICEEDDSAAKLAA